MWRSSMNPHPNRKFKKGQKLIIVDAKTPRHNGCIGTCMGYNEHNNVIFCPDYYYKKKHQMSRDTYIMYERRYAAFHGDEDLFL